MIVYKLENLINGKCYVGQTRRSLEQRIKEHGKSNMSAAHKGKKKSDSTRAKMSEYAKNRTPEHKAKLLEKQIGKIIPQETRDKISKSMKRFQECKRKEREKINSNK